MNKFSQDKLEEVAANSLYTSFTNSRTISYSFEIFKRFILPNKSILELGPAEGLMTKKLLEISDDITVIEGSKNFAEVLKKEFPKITVINSLFETSEIKQKFDYIILGHVLEHVENPEVILNSIKKWLKDDGLIFCAVPNARSLHRQAAVEMGLIKDIFEKSEKDIHHGHLRIYTPETFFAEFHKTNYEIISKGGYWLKPLSDSQIEKSWTQEQLDAFMKLGEMYPDIAAEIYVVAKNK